MSPGERSRRDRRNREEALFEEGRGAALSGRARADCPYPLICMAEQRGLWMAGYRVGEREMAGYRVGEREMANEQEAALQDERAQDEFEDRLRRACLNGVLGDAMMRFGKKL